MKTSVLTILLAIVAVTFASAADQSIFPIQISLDAKGVFRIYRFQPDGSYTATFEANEARGFPGGTDSGTYVFKSSKTGGTIILKDGAKLRFKLSEAPSNGKSVQTTGMLYDPKGTPAEFGADMSIEIKKL